MSDNAWEAVAEKRFHELVAMREERAHMAAIIRELAENGATYTNHSDGENVECAICGNVVAGSLYFRSWQPEEGHTPDCPVERAKQWVEANE